MYAPTNLADAKRTYDDDGIGGWIAPDGAFFQAHYSTHSKVARRIVYDVLGLQNVYYTSDYLEEHGWLRLETDGRINHPYQLTEQQFDVLYRCYMVATHRGYKRMVYTHIAPGMTELHHIREPKQPIPSQGDQENFDFQAWRRSAYAY